MKKYFLFSIVLITSVLSAKAQEKSMDNKFSISIIAGINKVRISNNSDFVVNDNVCIDFCERSIFKDSRFEVNNTLLGSINLNKKEELLIGVGINHWRYRVNLLNNITGEEIENTNEHAWMTNLVIGYRNNFLFVNDSHFFLESLFNSQLVLGQKFNILLFALEPGIGFNFPLSSNIKITTSLNYRFGITDISPNTFDQNKHRINALGIKCGFNIPL